MITPIFPTLIHQLKVDNYSSIKHQLIEFVYDERKKDIEGCIISNMGGWQSNPHYNCDNILFNTINQTLELYLQTNQIFGTDIFLDVESLWMNINNRGDYNDTHIHPLCDWVGCFYINTFDDCGGISFISPNHYSQGKELKWYNEDIKEKYNFFSRYEWKKPLEGTIFLFPPSIFHYVNKNQTDNDRISASFNIQIEKLVK